MANQISLSAQQIATLNDITFGGTGNFAEGYKYISSLIDNNPNVDSYTKFFFEGARQPVGRISDSVIRRYERNGGLRLRLVRPTMAPQKAARGNKRMNKPATASKHAAEPLLGEAALKEALAGFGVAPNAAGGFGPLHGAPPSNGSHAATGTAQPHPE